MESLQGYFLIATPQMPDPRFAESVIYLCVHNRDGAMGLIINQPLPDITLADIFREATIPVPDRALPPVYLGGPMEETSAFFLYSADYQIEPSLAISPSIRLTRAPRILHDLAAGQGPRAYLSALGYAGWAPGQLEGELSRDGWLTLPGSAAIVFHTPDDLKWRKAAQGYGIDITLFGDIVGTA